MSLNYTSVSDFNNYLSDNELEALSDDNGTGSIDTAVVTQHLTDAESEVDSYVAQQADVPLKKPPANVVKAVFVLARHSLLLRRGYVDEAYREKYNNMVSWLEKLADGKVKLLISGVKDERSDEVDSGLADKDDMNFEDFVF